MLGPKPFPLDRLMAIFYSIVEGKVAPTANIFMQVNLHKINRFGIILAVIYGTCKYRSASRLKNNT